MLRHWRVARDRPRRLGRDGRARGLGGGAARLRRLLLRAWTRGACCTCTVVVYVCDARGGRSGVEPDSRLGHGVVCVADCRPP